MDVGLDSGLIGSDSGWMGINTENVTDPTRKYPKKSLFNVVMMSIGSVFVFGSFTSTQALIGTIRPKSGFLALALLYLSFAVSNSFISSIVRVLGLKFSLIVGSAPYALFVFLAAVPWEWTLFVGSLVNGFGSAMYWCAQGQWITENAKISGLERMGLYSGIFWSSFMLNGILGNLLAGILKWFEAEDWKMFVILGCFGMFGTLMMIPLQDISSESREISKSDPSIFKDNRKQSKIGEKFQFLLDKRVLFVHMLSVVSGSNMAYCQSLLPSKFGKEKVSWVMIAFSISGMVSSLFVGKIADIFSKKSAMILSFQLLLLAVFLSFLWTISDFGLPYVIMGVWGIAFSSYMTVITTLLGGLFHGSQSGDIFAMFKMVDSLCGAIGFFGGSFLAKDHFWIISVSMVAIVSLGLINFIFMDLIVGSERNSSSNPNPPIKYSQIDEFENYVENNTS